MPSCFWSWRGTSCSAFWDSRASRSYSTLKAFHLSASAKLRAKTSQAGANWGLYVWSTLSTVYIHMKTLVPSNFLLTHCRHKHFFTVQDPPDMLLLILRRALTADPLRKALRKGLLCHDVVEVLQPTERASTCQLNLRIEFMRHMKQIWNCFT